MLLINDGNLNHVEILIIYDLQLSNLNSFHESFRLRKTENKTFHPAWLSLIEAEQPKGERLENLATKNSKILKKFLRFSAKRMAYGLKPFRLGEPFWLVTICQMSQSHCLEDFWGKSCKRIFSFNALNQLEFLITIGNEWKLTSSDYLI